MSRRSSFQTSVGTNSPIGLLVICICLFSHSDKSVYRIHLTALVCQHFTPQRCRDFVLLLPSKRRWQYTPGPLETARLPSTTPALTDLSPLTLAPQGCQQTSVLMSQTGSEKNPQEWYCYTQDANYFLFCVSCTSNTYLLPTSMPSACSRINPVEFLSLLFWTQAKYLPALQEKQVLERFATKQQEKTTTSCMGDTWRGLSPENHREGRDESRQDSAAGTSPAASLMARTTDTSPVPRKRPPRGESTEQGFGGPEDLAGCREMVTWWKHVRVTS